jgi:hypothetical protein
MISRSPLPLLLASIIAIPAPLLAQDASRPPDLSGAYMATGSNPGDTVTSYEAEVELKRTGEVVLALAQPERTAEVYRIKWKFAGGGAEVLGIGVLLDGVFYVAYADEKKFFLELWFPWTMSPGQRAVDAEIREKEGQSTKSYIKNMPWYADLDTQSEYAGLWFHYDETFGVGGLTGEDWIGKHPYRLHQLNKKFEWAKYGERDFWTEYGSLTVEQTGQNYHLRFRVSSDYSYSGAAIKGPGGSYVAGLGGVDVSGVAYYRFTARGLEGVWAVRGGEGRGTELLSPSDEVRKKAGSLFRDE